MEQTSTPDEAVATLSSPSNLEDGHLNEELGDSVTRYVVVEINHNLYGMSTESTVELMSGAMAQITRVPHSPDYITGVINHRGTIIPVIDMRSLFGFHPREADADRFAKMFEEFKKEYAHWLNALQDAIYANTDFTEPTDPTKCNFWKWYQSVLDGSAPLSKLAENDPILKSFVDRFETPHRRFYRVAEKAIKWRSEGEVEKAIDRINAVRSNELAELGGLFEQILNAVSTKLESMLVITEVGARKAAIAVDGVSFVIDCDNDTIESLPDTAENTEFLSGLVHQGDGSYILITDLEHVYNIACPEE